MEHVLVFIIGIVIGASVVYRYKVGARVTQSRTQIAEEQQFRKAREVRYIAN